MKDGIFEIKEDFIFKLNVITKVKKEAHWVLHLYVDSNDYYGFAYIDVYDKRIIDYLRYFDEIKCNNENIDLTWLVKSYDRCLMKLFKK